MADSLHLVLQICLDLKMARDRIREVLEVRKRARRGGPSVSTSDLESLARIADQVKRLEHADEFIPIRIITILEVFFRGWIERLIDHGSPYLQRATKLKLDLKFDLAMVGDIHDGVVTLGQLIAHSVSLNGVDAIATIFETLLGEDFFEAVSKARDRWAIEIRGEPDKPIIDNMQRVLGVMSRVFMIRHVLVHERPEKKLYQAEEIDDFLRSATMFVKAADEVLIYRLQGAYPLTQTEMNRQAGERYMTAADELKQVCAEIAEVYQSDTIHEVQKVWQAFLEAEATRQAEWVAGGTLWPTVYNSAAEEIARSRIDELRRLLEDEKSM